MLGKKRKNMTEKFDCVCDGCLSWNLDARGHQKSKSCTNFDHCKCCVGCYSCIGCNHFNVPLDDAHAIHIQATVHSNYPIQNGWELIDKMKIEAN